MSFLICVGALAFLMLVAYRGFSVILFAPIAAMGAVLLTDPSAVPPIFTGLFMDKMVGFVKLYFPVFLLGAVFGLGIGLPRIDPQDFIFDALFTLWFALAIGVIAALWVAFRRPAPELN